MTKSKEVIRCGYGNVITYLHQSESSRYRERKKDCNVLENSTNHRHPVASRTDWMEMALRWKARMEQSQHFDWTPQQVMDFVRRTWPFLFYINPKHMMRTMKQTLSTAQYWGEHPNNDPEVAEFNELMFGEEAQDEFDDLLTFLLNAEVQVNICWGPSETGKDVMINSNVISLKTKRYKIGDVNGQIIIEGLLCFSRIFEIVFQAYHTGECRL